MTGRQSDHVPTITELVRQRMDTGLSLRDLADRSGGVVAHQQFEKIKNGDVRGWPKSPEAIQATADALGVDARQVVLAYAAQFGLDITENRSTLAAMLPREAADLPLPVARIIADLIAELTRRGSSHAPSTTNPQRSDVGLAAHKRTTKGRKPTTGRNRDQ